MTTTQTHKTRILIVEDDHDVVLGLSMRLRASGYATAVAMDALTAMSAARKESPDLILLDLGLPAGDGFLVMERLQKLSALVLTPVVVLTARDVAVNRAKAYLLGAAAFLQKPAGNDELLHAIERALAGERTIDAT